MSDATAAIGICRRQGLGRIRHLAVADLWCQQVIRDKQVTLSKWPGTQNPADLFTKHLSRNVIMDHLKRMNLFARDGRASSACECMVVHGSARECRGVHGSARECTGVHGSAWECMGVHGSARAT